VDWNLIKFGVIMPIMNKSNVKKEYGYKIGRVLQLVNGTGDVFSIGLKSDERALKITFEDGSVIAGKEAGIEFVSFDAESDEDYDGVDQLSVLKEYILNALKPESGKGEFIVLYAEIGEGMKVCACKKVGLCDFNGIGIEGNLIAIIPCLKSNNIMLVVAVDNNKYPVAVF
jgi:hypothetical protein